MDRLAIALLLAAMLGACGGRATTPPPGSDELVADLHGAGASFPAPIYMEWITDFQADNPGVRTNYQSKGSSAGREQFIAGQVHFGASDAPMKDAEVEAAEAARGCPPLHIPTLFGGVALAYNLPAVEQLVLDGETIAGIALGDIVSADDPRIAALNPGVELPGQRLTFVHRSDGSGTTSIFTTYLDDVSPEWHERVGRGSEVEWPTGIGGDQNDGVASAIAQQPGGIGYVSYEFAAEAGIAVAAVVNADGNSVLPSSASVSAAAETVEVPDDFRFSMLGIGGDGYPIVGATWVLAWSCGYPDHVADALKGLLRWGLVEGDALTRELHYAPLPASLEQRVLRQVERINERGEGGP